MDHAKKAEKCLQTEALRGLAILLVVAHHAALILREHWTPATTVGSITLDFAGIQSGLFQPFRMPLFAILSGYVYALRPVTRSDSPAFLMGKMRRLFLPMAFAACCVFFVNSIFDRPTMLGVNKDIGPITYATIWKIWLLRNGQFWFIHVMLLCFASVWIIDRLGLMGSPSRWACWLLISSAAPYVIDIPGPVFSAGQFLDLLFFFLFGIGTFRFKSQLFTPRWNSLWFAVLGVAIITQIFWKLGGENFDPWPHFLAGGMAFAVCLRAFPLSAKPLQWLGGYSLTIYLFHTLGLRLLFLVGNGQSGPDWDLVVLGMTPLLGLGFPILIHMACERVPILATIALGLRGRVNPSTD